MKNIIAPLLILVSFSMFSIDSFSFVASQRSPLTQMRESEDCGTRSRNGRASQLGEIADMLHQAAWYQDRDNSMTPVSTEEGVGAAMALIMTHRSTGQAIQVCDGVYLANAHILMDPPNGPNGNGPLWHLMAYPVSAESMRDLPDSSAFVSPRVNNPAAWRDPSTDYVFFRVENPPNRESIRPVRGTDNQLASGRFSTTLYRPQTSYLENPDGTPNFESDLVGGAELMERSQTLYRVNQACDVINSPDTSLMGTNCPTENGVSGSPYTFESGGESYLLGIDSLGDDRSYTNFQDDDYPNAFVQSSHFCEDYESVCGQPCAELDEVLPQNGQSVSL